ncbi:MAG TPA: hypothetical protein VFS43_12740 [Polyangiaceae bacterium]|nr:hypothetical protein [Polyangiaceae bacterium]
MSLEADLERLVRPKRLRGRKARAVTQPSPRPASGPGRYVVLEQDAEVVLKATAYLDPDGVVRLRASCPGGYVVVEEREPTADELERAGAPDRASDPRPVVGPPPADVDKAGGGGPGLGRR